MLRKAGLWGTTALVAAAWAGCAPRPTAVLDEVAATAAEVPRAGAAAKQVFRLSPKQEAHVDRGVTDQRGGGLRQKGGGDFEIKRSTA